MTDRDELTDIPSLVPDRDDLDSRKKEKIAQSQDIVRPAQHNQLRQAGSWPLRIAVILLCLAAMAGGYGAYHFNGLYQDNLRQTNLRISDLELRLALVDESATESDNTLMENIEQTIEQYDLLWANWRENNRTFEDFRGEIARLKLTNESQDEIATAAAQSLDETRQTVQSAQARLNTLARELTSLGQSLTAIEGQMQELASLRGELESVRQALNSGDSTVLGLAGRLEFVEESMESVNAHRLQINQTLFRLQESIEALQVQINNSRDGF